MSSSYRRDMNEGRMKEEAMKLEKAVSLMQEVLDVFHEYACDEDQNDNATDDGIFIGRLQIAIALIREELPSPSGA